MYASLEMNIADKECNQLVRDLHLNRGRQLESGTCAAVRDALLRAL